MQTLIGKNICEAKRFLEQGDVIAVPTETVYGLAANANIESAVRKIFEIKNRPFTNPVILHFHNQAQMTPYINEIPKTLKALADAFWPGPFTLLLEKTEIVSNKITAVNARVAVRIPSNPTFLELLKTLDYPLAAPSANPYGKISPTSAQHVFDYFDTKIPFILDGGRCHTGIESTIVGLEQDKVVIYRYGTISPEQIKNIIGYWPIVQNLSINKVPEASGMVLHHYAPDTPCYVFKAQDHTDWNPHYGYILFGKHAPTLEESENIVYLSNTQNENEAAARLYEIMHSFDQKKFAKIFIELLPDSGIGLAINDKILRASAKYKA